MQRNNLINGPLVLLRAEKDPAAVSQRCLPTQEIGESAVLGIRVLTSRPSSASAFRVKFEKEEEFAVDIPAWVGPTQG